MATGVSKGTVQNRRDEIEVGDLRAPKETFALVRDREREFHRANQDTAVATDVMTKQITDRLTAVRKLDSFGFGPDTDLSYDDLTAFAMLVARQLKNTTPQDVVGQLAEIVELVDDILALAATVLDQFKQSRRGISAWQRAGYELEQNVKNRHPELSSPGDPSLDKTNQMFSPQFNQELNDKWEQNLSGDTMSHSLDLDEDECQRRGGTFDPIQKVCHLDGL